MQLHCNINMIIIIIIAINWWMSARLSCWFMCFYPHTKKKIRKIFLFFSLFSWCVLMCWEYFGYLISTWLWSRLRIGRKHFQLSWIFISLSSVQCAYCIHYIYYIENVSWSIIALCSTFASYNYATENLFIIMLMHMMRPKESDK